MKSRPVRRRRASTASRLLQFWILLAVVCAASGVAGYWAVRWPGFRPHVIRVTGNAAVSSARILAAARIARDGNLWLQNMGAAERRVDAIPLIERAWIHRRLPSDVTIAVRERTPFAVLDAGTATAAGTGALGRFVVDRELRVLYAAGTRGADPPLELDPGVALALVPGEFVRAERAILLRDDADALAAGGVRVRRLSFDRYESLVATLPGGMLVLLGDDGDLSVKIPLIEPILAQAVHGNRAVRAIDLRAPNTPVIVYK